MSQLPLSAQAGPARIPTRPPRFQLSSEDKYTSTIKIDNWTITSTKKPILNGQEIDAAEKRLNLPLPEMTFGNNSLTLQYSPSQSSTSLATSDQDRNDDERGKKESEVSMRFNGLDALAEVGVGEGWEERTGGGVLVSMAESWGKNRSQPSQLLSDTPLPARPVKPHDWTFSTCHTGVIAGPSKFVPSSTHSIPLQLLARQDPILDQILYYADVPLFEDELHDNGESILNARIRVMPHSFFILYRLFLRVDNVLFRLYDIRIYHQFGSGEVIREVVGTEADYETIKSKLDQAQDLSPLTNPQFVHAAMQSLGESAFKSCSKVEGKAWPGLGRRVEVMHLPQEGMESSMRDLSL